MTVLQIMVVQMYIRDTCICGGSIIKIVCTDSGSRVHTGGGGRGTCAHRCTDGGSTNIHRFKYKCTEMRVQMGK